MIVIISSNKQLNTVNNGLDTSRLASLLYLYSKTKEAGAVGSYATFALQSLDRTMEVGQRRIQPMELEIQRIEEKQPISIKVYFLDGTFRTLLVTSQTRAQQVTMSLSSALRLNHGQ